MSPNLEAALEYAGLGLRVLPLEPRSKKPAIARWQERATKDARQIRRWFERWPDANVGILTGDGLVFIDIDPARGGDESFAQFVAGRDLPETATARTPTGGRHFAYIFPVPVGCLVNVLPGLDVRGTGGQVAVAPSIHPATGTKYRWPRHPSLGIAAAPGWMVDFFTEERSSSAGSHAPGRGPKPVGGRLGDERLLLADVIARFPIPSVGCRNDLMVKAVGSLLGRGFDGSMTLAVVGGWWDHFHGLGVVGTDPGEAAGEIRKVIAILERSTTFRVAVGPDHEALCRAIQLTEEQRRLLGADVAELVGLGIALGIRQTSEWASRADGGLGSNTKSLTRNSPLLSDRLCRSGDEATFVEAVLVHATYKVMAEPGELIRMTGDQIRAVAGDRGNGGKWADVQLERLKAKYFWRPAKPATRYELLREVTKGDHRPGLTVGTPSEFMPTGIRVFLAAGAGAGNPETRHQAGEHEEGIAGDEQ